jgi:hypothetical protein
MARLMPHRHISLQLPRHALASPAEWQQSMQLSYSLIVSNTDRGLDTVLATEQAANGKRTAFTTHNVVARDTPGC